MLNNNYSVSAIGETLMPVNENMQHILNMLAGSPITYVVVDIAEVLRAYSKGMCEAFNMGLQASECLNTNLPVGNVNIAPFIGIYDRNGYGVYNDETLYAKSLGYWDNNTCNSGRFQNYEDALNFAINGLAAYNNLPLDSIPPMERQLNWRQRLNM